MLCHLTYQWSFGKTGEYSTRPISTGASKDANGRLRRFQSCRNTIQAGDQGAREGADLIKIYRCGRLAGKQIFERCHQVIQFTFSIDTRKMNDHNPVKRTERFNIEYRDQRCHIIFYVEPVEGGVHFNPEPERIIFGNAEDISDATEKRLIH